MTTITQQNYLEQAPKIAFSRLPPALGEFDKLYRPNFTDANKDTDLKPVIGIYFVKLNKQFRLTSITKDNAKLAKARYGKPKVDTELELRLRIAKAKALIVKMQREKYEYENN